MDVYFLLCVKFKINLKFLFRRELGLQEKCNKNCNYVLANQREEFNWFCRHAKKHISEVNVLRLTS